MDTNKLRTALGDTSEILSEAIIRCQLSHRAKDSDLLELKRQLDDILASVLLYKSLSNTLPPSSFLSTSFLRFAFPRAPAEPGCFGVLLDALCAAKVTFGEVLGVLTSISSSPYPSAQSQNEGVEATLVAYSQSIPRHFAALDRAFRSFWLYHLTQKTFSLESMTTTRLENSPRDTPEPEHPLFRVDASSVADIVQSQDRSLLWETLSSDISTEAHNWADAWFRNLRSEEVRRLIVETAWCGPLGDADTLLRDIHDRSRRIDSPSRFRSPTLKVCLERILSRSFLSNNIVAPYGSSMSGKSTLINGFIGSSILPPDGLQTSFPCRILHRPDQHEPRMAIPVELFKVVVDTLRSLRFYERKARYDALADPRTSLDRSLPELIENWQLLGDDQKFFEGLDRDGYVVPASADGIIAIRQLLYDLNSIISICHAMKLCFIMPRLQWPVITVEYCNLSERLGTWEFWDLPAHYPDETSLNPGDYYDAIVKSNASVILLAQYLAKLGNINWNGTLNALLQVRASTTAVICTDIEQASSEDDRFHFIQDISLAFFPGVDNPPVFICDLVYGTESAAYLRLLQRMGHKVPYAMLQTDKKSLEYRFVARSFFGARPENQKGIKSYEVTPDSDMELRVEDVLRLSNFDQILPEIIGLVEKSSVRSKDEEFRLFVDTCAALEGETSSLIGHIVEAIAQLDDEATKTRELYLKAMQVETINLVHVTSLVKEEIARIIDDLGHATQQIVHFIINEYSDSSQLESVIDARSLDPLLATIQRHLQGNILSVISRHLEHVKQAAAVIVVNETEILHQAQKIAALAPLQTFPERLDFSGISPDLFTIRAMDPKRYRGVIRRFPSASSLYQSSRENFLVPHSSSLFTRVLASVCALLPFLYRWVRSLWVNPRYRLDVQALVLLYRQSVSAQWLVQTEGHLTMSLTSAVNQLPQSLGRSMALTDGALQARKGDLRLLWSLKGNLHAVNEALRHLDGNV